MQYLIRIVVDDIFNLCFHIYDNLMVCTLCCCFYSSAYKTLISINKAYNLLVVWDFWLHTPRLCITWSESRETSIVSIRLPSMVADRMSEFSLR